MQNAFTQPQAPATLTSKQQEVVSAFLRGVYNWMAGGLALTGLVAWLALSSETVFYSLFNSQTGQPTLLWWILAIGEFALVVGINSMINRISASTAGLLFAIYSALNGLTISGIFLVYTDASLASTFFIAAGTFAVVSIWAYSTKRNLVGWGPTLSMCLVGFIIASVVGMITGGSAFHLILGYMGVALFIGLIAYYTQWLRQMALSQHMDQETGNKMAVVGALFLYISFINLFLLLLRIFGDRR